MKTFWIVYLAVATTGAAILTGPVAFIYAGGFFLAGFTARSAIKAYDWPPWLAYTVIPVGFVYWAISRGVSFVNVMFCIGMFGIEAIIGGAYVADYCENSSNRSRKPPSDEGTVGSNGTSAADATPDLFAGNPLPPATPNDLVQHPSDRSAKRSPIQ